MSAMRAPRRPIGCSGSVVVSRARSDRPLLLVSAAAEKRSRVAARGGPGLGEAPSTPIRPPIALTSVTPAEKLPSGELGRRAVPVHDAHCIRDATIRYRQDYS